jgi:two-component system, cell cycle sensor histidine kinase and response regulator CckA
LLSRHVIPCQLLIGWPASIVPTQRSLAQVFLALQAGLTAILAAILAVQRSVHAAPAALAAVVYTGCWLAFRRGWGPARQVAVVSVTVLLVVAVREPYLTERVPMAALVPPLVALMLTSAPWIVASALIELAALTLRSGGASPLLQPIELMVFVMAVSGMVVARRSMDSAMARLAAQAERAEAARQQAEAARQQAEAGKSEAIAERHRAIRLEAALLHMQRLESVGRLAGGVAHDFNNLLTVIGASTSMAQRALATGASATDDLKEIHVAVARASELTKQLLAFARKQVLVKRNVELNELVSNVERMLRRLIGGNIVLSARLCSQPLRILADAGQIEQVIVNLVINARDAMPGAGRIEISTERVVVSSTAQQGIEGLSCGEYACLEVRDSGLGMTDEVQRQLFEPFFTTKPAGRGTGLGLATSFGIIHQHEGTIVVESAAGKGTLMRVLVPLSSSADAMASSGVVPLVERHRVLVVEDEPQVRAIAARALTNAGFEVLQAANGAIALAMLKADDQPFDVILTDVLMPELNGPELARAVLTLHPDIGLVFMSGYPEAMQGVGPDEFDGACFLSKPFSPQQLVALVRDCVERRRGALLAQA